MATLTSEEIGAIVYNLVDNIPTGISGLLTTLTNQSVYYAERFTGNTIGTTAIAETYQPAIINLTVGNVLGLMEAQGLGTQSVKIGELSVTKGMSNNSSSSFQSLADKQLSQIGQHASWYQCWN